MKKQQKSISKRRLLTAGVIVGALLLISQLYIDFLLLRRPTPVDNTMAQLIDTAIDNLYKPAVTDPKTGLNYIPELRLSLPIAETNAAQIRYTYQKERVGDDSLAQITTNGLLSRGKVKLLTAGVRPDLNADQKFSAVFDVVPSAQACARGLQLYDRPTKLDTAKQVVTLQLGDDRTMYGYIENACNEDTSILIDTIKQAKSY